MSQIIYPPAQWQQQAGQRSVFLAGSIDMGAAEDWQAALAQRLAAGNWLLLNPRRRDWDASWAQRIDNEPFRTQVEWELDGLERADCIAFYFAPQSKAPITLLELGLWARSGKAVVCCADDFWRKGNIDIVCQRYQVPQVATLDELARYIEDKFI